MKGTKAWKVVTRQRNSCIVKGTPYNLKYKKGATVRAHEKTIGIMCFDNYSNALYFKQYWDKKNTWLILEVRGYKRRRFGLICGLHTWFGDIRKISTLRLKKFYNRKKRGWGQKHTGDILNGCVLFDRVEVLT